MLNYTYSRKIKFRNVFFFFNLGIFACCTLYLLNYYYQGYANENEIDNLRTQLEAYNTEVDVYEIEDHIPTSSGNAEENKRAMLPSYKKLREGDYPYLVGNVKIEGTPIDYFVMQTPDDPWMFLKKDVLGNYNYEGTPFIDVQCDLEKPSNNIIIYAHAMKNQHQFGSLRKYKSEEYYKEHPVIEFETLYEPKCEYEIVAAFYSQVYKDSDLEPFKYYYFFGCDNEQDFDYFIDNIKSISCYDTGIVPKYGDQLITLSTCNNERVSDGNGRFAVVARKITDDDNNDNSQDNKNSKIEGSNTISDQRNLNEDNVNGIGTVDFEQSEETEQTEETTNDENAETTEENETTQE